MRTPRLLVDAPLVLHEAAALSDDQAHRLTRVLRLRANASVRAFDGDGQEYVCTLQRDGPRWCLVPTEQVAPVAPSPLRITLAQSVSRNERMDFALQKAVELGVACIQPIIAERSTFKPQSSRLRNRQSHWQRVIAQACEQCGRADLAELCQPRESREWMADNRGAVLLSADAEVSLSDVPIAQSEVAVLIGPEGGFSDDEMRTARDSGLTAARLGPRTMRTETAAVVALTVLQFREGDLGR